MKWCNKKSREVKRIIMLYLYFSIQIQLDKRPLAPGTSREASGVPCLHPRRGLTLLSPVCIKAIILEFKMHCVSTVLTFTNWVGRLLSWSWWISTSGVILISYKSASMIFSLCLGRLEKQVSWKKFVQV